MTLEELKQEYIQEYKDEDCKYLIFKLDDLMDSIETWNHWEAVQYIIALYNKKREEKGKGINKYFVVNRDEYPYKTAQEFIDALNNSANVAL